MLAVALTLLFCTLCLGAGDLVVRRWTADFDPAARLGLAGMFGVSIPGFLLFSGVFAKGNLTTVCIFISIVLCGIGLWGWRSIFSLIKAKPPQGASVLFLVALLVSFLFAIICIIGPSDSLDWDSLAYHLAVPKLWLSHGQIDPISFIHHSNFPFMVDNLYLLGLLWGGAAGAKAFSLAYLGFGVLTVFGLVRSWYSASAAWWSVLSIIAIPTVLWESGTAYIDVAHGLWAGIGVLLVARNIAVDSRKEFCLGAACLGCAVASKYTGLQTAIAVSVCVVLFSFRAPGFQDGFKKAMIIGAAALVLGLPWFARNVLNTGNPVFPFFYEKFGGKNWDQFSADIYRDEQQTFGVGRSTAGRDFKQIGHSVLGLAYQPGRYTNPRQTEGGGFPTGALGFLVIASGVAWSFSGRVRKFEAFVLASVGISFLFWFLLSQQSRYMLNVAIPLAVLVGPAIMHLRIGKLLAGLAICQFSYSIWMVYSISVKPKLPVVLGTQSQSDFYKANGPTFALAAPRINELAKGGKVALFDEVFGFFLDVSYFWANPGHSTEIGYQSLSNGEQFSQSLSKLGITHCYLNLALMDPGIREKFLASSGLKQGTGFTAEEEASMKGDPRSKWPVLFADAVRKRLIQPLEGLPGGIVFRIEN